MGTVPNNTLDFNSDQDTVLSGLASNMKIVAIALLILAPVKVAFGVIEFGGWGINPSVTNGLLCVVEGLLSVLMFFVLLKGARDVRYAVETKGYDKEHLLNAVESLTVFYRVVVGAGIAVLLFSTLRLIFRI
jgi:hypothetical protein